MTLLEPSLRLLDSSLVEKMINEARTVLAEIGIEFLGERARQLLDEKGVKQKDGRHLLPSSLIDEALESVPSSFTMYDRDGAAVAELGKGGVNFVPGSSALHYFDYEKDDARHPTTDDFIHFTKVTDALPHMYATSTAFVPADFPEEISDAWRLYLALRYSSKPCVTGAFSTETLSLMADLLEAVRGSREALAEKPLAIFSVCPSSPLRFTEATSDNLIECAERKIPCELIGMPISGLVAPATLIGSLIQHTVEDLSGVVLSQLANPGAPLLWGGSPAVFDIRCATTPLGAIESMMIASGYVQIGKVLGLPTQCYMGSSDSKILDYQCGMETSWGLMMATMSGADSVSGPGMFELENCQSAEKLIIDNELCGQLHFLQKKLEPQEDFPASPIMERLLKEKNLIIDEHTNKHRPSQRHDPTPIINRADRKRWEKKGRTTVLERAHAQIEKMLKKHKPKELSSEMDEKLRAVMKKASEPYDVSAFASEL